MIDQICGPEAIAALEARGIPMPDLSACRPRPVTAALRDMVDLLHKSDDYMTEIEDAIKDEILVSLMRNNLDGAFQKAEKLLEMQKGEHNES